MQHQDKKRKKKKTSKLWKLLPYVGIIKRGKKSTEKDIDQVVYSKKAIGGIK